MEMYSAMKEGHISYSDITSCAVNLHRQTMLFGFPSSLSVVFFLAGPMLLYFKTQFKVPILWEVFPYDLNSLNSVFLNLSLMVWLQM